LQTALAYAKSDNPANRSVEVQCHMRKPPETPGSASRAATFGVSLPLALLNAFNTNNRINQYLIDNIPAAGWNAKPPGGKGRTIPTIIAHMHNVRIIWLKAATRDDKDKSILIPMQLDSAKVTPSQALRALEQSRHALSVVLSRALESDGRIKGFRPDVAGFVSYLIAHDAHHRGQIAILARQSGHPLHRKPCSGCGNGVRPEHPGRLRDSTDPAQPVRSGTIQPALLLVRSS
jgi:uncharacterized damage-inducible protein DinB